ncbi:metallophosphoesterase [Candidatus Woesearchaeota archaeon]|nr:MAG: metallophosphoesterase [Candidatus Woesearchaeota archaeon]
MSVHALQFRSCALKIDETLILCDVHLGYEKSLQRVQLPLFQFEDIIAQLQEVLRNDHFKRIIINGDLKDEFSRISNQEWRHVTQFLELCKEHCDDIIVIKGNHDTLLNPIIRKFKITFVDTYQFDDVFVCHGDKKIPLPDECKVVIIGHEHPAITLREGVRTEKYKCFLVGNYEGKQLIVLPAFYSAHQGSDITSAKRLSPFLPKNLDSFEVFVVGDTVYPFGKVKNIPQ